MKAKNPALLRVLMLILLLFIVALLASAFYRHKNADALWEIVHERCVPAAKSGNPAPCQQVNVSQGYATLKDRNGPLQYLLLLHQQCTLRVALIYQVPGTKGKLGNLDRRR